MDHRLDGRHRGGAAYQHLRLAKVSPIAEYGRCHGRLWSGSPGRSRGGERSVCPGYVGLGVALATAPTLALAAD